MLLRSNIELKNELMQNHVSICDKTCVDNAELDEHGYEDLNDDNYVINILKLLFLNRCSQLLLFSYHYLLKLS